uniref:Uncharacterized protein n=1 Tax=Schistocephalus solidus TaxID=70667 RepID=A0A0X3P3Z4_SCHSO
MKNQTTIKSSIRPHLRSSIPPQMQTMAWKKVSKRMSRGGRSEEPKRLLPPEVTLKAVRTRRRKKRTKKSASSRSRSSSSGSSNSSTSSSESGGESSSSSSSDSDDSVSESDGSSGSKISKNTGKSSSSSSSSSSSESESSGDEKVIEQRKESSPSSRRSNAASASEPMEADEPVGEQRSSDEAAPSSLLQLPPQPTTTHSSLSSPSPTSPGHLASQIIKPLHATRVVFLPYLPLSVHRSTVESMFSAHPDFLRFACLDPIPVPAANSLGDPLAPAVRSTTASGLVVSRPAWVTFTANPTSPESEDLLAFCHRLSAEQLTAESPSVVTESGDVLPATGGSPPQSDTAKRDLAACLLAARLLPIPFCQDRVRTSSRLLTALARQTAGGSIHPICRKSIMRRHLVMAARLAARLDAIHGFWTKTGPDPSTVSNKEHEQEEKTEKTGEAMDVTEEDATHPKDSVRSPQSPSASLLDRFVLPRPEDLDPEDNLIAASAILSEISANSANVLLDNLTDHLVDEGNTEEELLLLGGLNFRPTPAAATASPSQLSNRKEKDPEADPELTRALDRLIIYLRLVYSIDFYAPALYCDESDMPHVCAIIHVRPSIGTRIPSPPPPVFF